MRSGGAALTNELCTVFGHRVFKETCSTQFARDVRRAGKSAADVLGWVGAAFSLHVLMLV